MNRASNWVKALASTTSGWVATRASVSRHSTIGVWEWMVSFNKNLWPML